MTNQIENLLGEVNRLFQERVQYCPAGSDEYSEPIPATRESIETAEYSSDGAPQSWRQIAFSFETADIRDGNGNQITPRRGDRLKAKDGIYRLIEYNGLAYTPRFDAGFSDRILIYFEREKNQNADG